MEDELNKKNKICFSFLSLIYHGDYMLYLYYFKIDQSIYLITFIETNS